MKQSYVCIYSRDLTYINLQILDIHTYRKTAYWPLFTLFHPLGNTVQFSPHFPRDSRSFEQQYNLLNININKYK